jgi:ABC-2 type transport system ATP-binding protein
VSVQSGETLAVVGPNGAGKTTLIQLIAGLRLPSRGRVTVAGSAAQSKVARAQTGFLPERSYLPEFLSGREYLRFCGTLASLQGSDLERRVERGLEGVGLTGAADLRLKAYSKGMLQRVGIAGALVHDPKILLLDEPMSGLDPDGREEVRKVIREASAAGKTIIFSTHLLEDVEALCDRVLMIDHGRAPACVAAADSDRLFLTGVLVVFSGASLPGAEPERVPGRFRKIFEDASSAAEGVRRLSLDGATVHRVVPRLRTPSGANPKEAPL